MSISFACPQCGKPFTVDDRFAGKKGKCKQCGSVMSIPGAAPVGATRGPEVSPSRRAPVAPDPGPPGDVYGFDEAPLPSPPSRLATIERGGGPPSRDPIRAGFAAPGPNRARSSKGTSAVTIIVRIVLGVVGGFGGLVAVAVVLPAIRSGLVPGGWAPRSEIEGFIKRQITLTDELTGILRAVTDVPTATEASPRANASIRKLSQNLRSNKDRKGNQKVIDELKQKYEPDQRRALQAFTGEIQRVAMIPGALDALSIQDTLQELAALEQSIPGVKAQAGVEPPVVPGPAMTPPTTPDVEIPVAPTAAPSSPPSIPPNFPAPPTGRPGPRGRPAMPGPPPGWVPDGKGGYAPPGMPRGPAPPGAPPGTRPPGGPG